jgi:hypothetical protein
LLRFVAEVGECQDFRSVARPLIGQDARVIRIELNKPGSGQSGREP